MLDIIKFFFFFCRGESGERKYEERKKVVARNEKKGNPLVWKE